MAFFFSFLVEQLNVLLLITQCRLSIPKASSSFKCLNTHKFTYTTPTYITEALRLLTQVQLLLIDFTVN